MSWHRTPSKSSTSTRNHIRRSTARASTARQCPSQERKPARRIYVIAGSVVAAAATSISLVATWPASASVQHAAAAPRANVSHESGATALVAQQQGWLLAAQKSAFIIARDTGRYPVISQSFIASRNAALRAAVAAARRARASGGQSAPGHVAQAVNARGTGSQGATRRTVAAPVASGTPRQIGLAMLATFGWSTDQFSCLDALWARESGWNTYAMNPGSGAYGIPQALPGSKMASAGPDWQGDPATQIRWGLGYIQSTYGSPCAAWGHEQATGWY